MGKPLTQRGLPEEIPRRALGRTGEYVSALGLGGYHLGLRAEREAIAIVHEAIESALTFMDNAWEYHAGKSEERMGKALVGRRDRVFLMTKCCTHGRDAKTAMRQLDESLRRLSTRCASCAKTCASPGGSNG